MTRLEILLKKRLVELSLSTTPEMKLLKKRLDYTSDNQLGDQYEHYRGRKPKGGDVSAIDYILTIDDKIGPGIKRFLDALFPKAPAWYAGIKGTDVTSSLIKKAESSKGVKPKQEDLDQAQQLEDLELLMTTLEKEAGLINLMRKAARFALQVPEGCCIRTYVPDDYKDLPEFKTTKKFVSSELALQYLQFQVVSPLEGGPLIDSHKRIVGYFYKYMQLEEDENTLEPTEVHYVELHEPELTRIFKWVAGELLEQEELRTNNPFYQADRIRNPVFMMFHVHLDPDEPIVTPSLMSKQDRINISSTNMANNDDIGGHRVLYTINAQSPTAVDETTGKEKKTEWKFQPDIVLEVRGLPIDNAPTNFNQGGKQYHDAEVGTIDPVDPNYFIDGIAHWEDGVLQDLDQTHIKQGFKAVSGDSKKESREPFEGRIISFAPTFADAYAWLLSMASSFAHIKGQLELKPSTINWFVRLRANVSRGSIQLFQALVQARPGKINASLETIVSANPGVEDEDTELGRIQSEQDQEEAAAAQQAQDLFNLGGGNNV